MHAQSVCIIVPELSGNKSRIITSSCSFLKSF